MDKTKLKLAAFFDQDDEEPSAKPVNQHKLSHFTQGSVRKSKKDKEKEDEERKAREEEEAAAQVLAEYVDAFESEGPKRQRTGGGFVRAGGPSYNPVTRGGHPPPTKPAAMFQEQDDEDVPRPKGKRAMDSFLDEIKRDQADREARFSRSGPSHGRSSATAMAAYEGQSGSRDRGDQETSNLFVANMPTHVTEQAVGMFFAKYGPVGSVKVMWPRNDASMGPGADMNTSRRVKSSGLSGFVSYMKRKDAEIALRELDGFSWNGSILRVGWSKAVSLPARPVYVSATAPADGATRERRNDRHDRRSGRSRSRSPRRRSRSRSFDRGFRSRRSRSRSRSRESGHDSEGLGEEISDEFIRTVVAQIKGNDEAYEQSILEREKANARYAFFAQGHPKHRYYRSLLAKTRAPEPEFDDDGYNSMYSTDSEEEEEKENGQKTELGRLARRRFQAMLRGLSGRRGELARCMAFSLEHAEAASEVADLIVASLLVDTTPVPRKVSRLHLICDILHNSAIPLPGAWRFRLEFQGRLGLVFDHLSGIYHSFPGRITAETFKNQITAIIDIWEDWIVFPPEFTSQLRSRLEGQAMLGEEYVKEEKAAKPEEVQVSAEVSRFKSSSFKPATTLVNTGVAADVDGEPMNEGTDDDLDGAPVEHDFEGAPVDDIDGAPMDDVDGMPMEDLDEAPLEDIDGEAIASDEDLDGAPMVV